MMPEEVEFFYHNIGNNFHDTSAYPAFSYPSTMLEDLAVSCDVIEGACTVDCGGARKIVCDTGDFSMYFQESPQWSAVDFLLKSYEQMEAESKSCFNTYDLNTKPCDVQWARDWQGENVKSGDL